MSELNSIEEVEDTPLRRFERRIHAVEYLLQEPLTISEDVRQLVMFPPVITAPEPEVGDSLIAIRSERRNYHFL